MLVSGGSVRFFRSAFSLNTATTDTSARAFSSLGGFLNDLLDAKRACGRAPAENLAKGGRWSWSDPLHKYLYHIFLFTCLSSGLKENPFACVFSSRSNGETLDVQALFSITLVLKCRTVKTWIEGQCKKKLHSTVVASPTVIALGAVYLFCLASTER